MRVVHELEFIFHFVDFDSGQYKPLSQPNFYNKCGSLSGVEARSIKLMHYQEADEK